MSAYAQRNKKKEMYMKTLLLLYRSFKYENNIYIYTCIKYNI